MVTDARAGSSSTRIAVLSGVSVAVIVLLVAAFSLTGTDGSAFKAMAAVWLAALPLLGVGALLGWLASRLLPRRRAITAAMPSMGAPTTDGSGVTPAIGPAKEAEAADGR